MISLPDFPARHFAAAVLFCLACAGCASAPPAHFYTLIGNASDTSVRAAESPRSDLHVMIDSVTVPDGVDRAELVIRTGSNSVRIAEDRLWAEPLAGAVARAIALDLGERLSGATVTTRADRTSRDAGYIVSIDLTRFDSILGEAAVIEALWSVKSAANGTTQAGRSAFRIAVHGPGFDDLVAAHDEAFGDLSADIAAQIVKMIQ